MRLTLPPNSSSSDGRTYFLSPQIRRLRQGRASAIAPYRVRRSGVDSLIVSTVWNGSRTFRGTTRLPLASYLPSQRSSVVRGIGPRPSGRDGTRHRRRREFFGT